MKSKRSKMLHRLCGLPMITHVVRTVRSLQPSVCAIVVGYQREEVMACLNGYGCEFVIQEEQKGTGHAVSLFLEKYRSLDGLLLVVNGDTPLIPAGFLQNLIEVHAQKGADVSLVTTEVSDPSGYGRVTRDEEQMLQRIVEEADASPQEKQIREINSGIYLFPISLLREWLPRLKSDNRQGEYYLPDVIPLALQERRRVMTLHGQSEDVLGINTRVELAAAEKILRGRINRQWMLAGVTMHDPDRTYIDADVQIGTDTVLYPNVYLEGTTRIGSEVTIYPNCRITDSSIGDRCTIFENTTITSAQLEQEVIIGPFARVRPESYICKGAHIGNFVELKKTKIGEGSKANHLSYLGDATIGSGVNIGAGTITCNYDGTRKYPTVIEDEVFVGSDTQLIAPVTVGRGAYIAAGSSITEDVPPGALAIARSKQVNKEEWVAKKKQKKK